MKTSLSFDFPRISRCGKHVLEESGQFCLKHPRCHTFLRSWLSLLSAKDTTGDLPLPQYDPSSDVGMLPHILLLEEQNQRLVFRVTGEVVGETFELARHDPVFTTIIKKRHFSWAQDSVRQCLNGKSCFLTGRFGMSPELALDLEYVFLPIERRQTVMVLGVQSRTAVPVNPVESVKGTDMLASFVIDLCDGSSRKAQRTFATGYAPFAFPPTRHGGCQ